jgi:PAS domain S-box-containing protein
MVHAISNDNQGGVWLSMWLSADEYGLVHLVDGKVTEKVPWRELGGGPGTGLAPETDGTVWTGLLSGGLAHFGKGQIGKVPLTDAAGRSRRMLELERDRDGSLWAATEFGLSRIANGHVATLTTANGLPCNAVHWIIGDESSYWLYTRCGLLRITRTEMQAWAADPKRTIRPTTLDTADGIRLVAALKGFRPAVTKAPDGSIWFLNGDSVSVIDPRRAGINNLPPPVHIEQIAADGRKYDGTHGLRLPARIRNLVIDYTALSFVAPEKVRFRYKLDGQDPDWREVVNDRRVQYSNLAPGAYKFRVAASNNTGVWNEAGDVAEFSIAPAYYQTNWFRALVVAVCLGLLWVAWQFRVRQMRRESEQLRDVIETIPAMAWTALPDGSSEFVNRRWAEYTGLSAEDMAASGWAAAVHPDDRQAHLEKWRASLSTGEPMASEARFRCAANGEYRWFLIRGVPLRDGHRRIQRWYGILTDIHEARQERERLRQLEADLAHINRVSLMGELSASIAHEVNQPLTGIVSNGSACLRWLAADKPEIAEVREAVADMVRDGKRAGDVIARIRALTTRTAPPQERLDLEQTIREVLALASDEANGNAVRVQTAFSQEACFVLGDRVQLQQVLLNLVMNAIQSMIGVKGRPRTLTISTRTSGADEAEVTVADSGTGLDPEAITHIFEPFYTTRPGGMGMGLSISRSIVQLHGGRLWATANDGPGTTFHFTLPGFQGETQNAGVAAI